MSLPRRLYEARRVSTASSSGTLVLSVGQSDCKEVSATDAVESQFFRHVLLLIHKVSYDSGYKKNRVSAPKSSDLGASKTRFHPNLLLHYFLKFTKSATLISQSPDSHYHRLAWDLLIRYSFLLSIISKRN